MQTDPKHPPEQTAASNGLLWSVRILLSTHSHVAPAAALRHHDPHRAVAAITAMPRTSSSEWM